jgi:CRISPR-associated protein Cst2
VSAEAIRYALREGWQTDPDVLAKLNRKVGQAAVNANGSDSTWANKSFNPDAKEEPKYVTGTYIDDDVLGYMNANAGLTRRGILEVSRAISTTPWLGEVSPHFASPGSNVSIKPNEKTKQYEPVPYGCEVHNTRYQYTFAMTPASLLAEKYARTEKTLRALQNLRRVGGSHARFLFDFAPEAVVLRWTTDPAPRIMFCFDQDDRGRLSLATLLRRIKGGDVDAKDVYVGTAIAGIAEMDALRAEGVNVFDGVKRAVDAVLASMKTDLDAKG